MGKAGANWEHLVVAKGFGCMLYNPVGATLGGTHLLAVVGCSIVWTTDCPAWSQLY
jgi:hypothetical protein